MQRPESLLPFLGLGSERQLRALADALPVGLFTTDVEGTITFWSRGAERITGFSREEAVGRPCSLLAGDPAHGCACADGPIRCGLAARGRSSKACALRHRDGHELQIVKHATPVFTPSGAPIGALETFTKVEAALVRDLSADPPGAAGADGGDFFGMTGRHAVMRDLFRLLALVARSDAAVLLVGESGVGKELAAEAVHRLGARAARPFVRVSCSALDDVALQSELFGHVAGAFPGALRERRGRFQEADGGTLLLDKIEDLSPLVQGKLLRVIEQRELERLGDPVLAPVDVRLLAATSQDLRPLVAAGRFRADLYFRLAAFPVRVPALREHLEDLELLVERFLSRRGLAVRLSRDAAAALRAQPWPGNVRELQNAVEYAALQAREGEIRPEHLPPAVAWAGPGREGPRSAPGRDGAATVDPRERQETLEALLQAGWNQTRAARALGVSRVTLWKRMRRHGLARGPAGRR